MSVFDRTLQQLPFILLCKPLKRIENPAIRLWYLISSYIAKSISKYSFCIYFVGIFKYSLDTVTIRLRAFYALCLLDQQDYKAAKCHLEETIEVI